MLFSVMILFRCFVRCCIYNKIHSTKELFDCLQKQNVAQDVEKNHRLLLPVSFVSIIKKKIREKFWLQIIIYIESLSFISEILNKVASWLTIYFVVTHKRKEKLCFPMERKTLNNITVTWDTGTRWNTFI